MRYKDIKIGQMLFWKEPDGGDLCKDEVTVIRKYDKSKIILLITDGGGLIRAFCNELSENPK